MNHLCSDCTHATPDPRATGNSRMTYARCDHPKCREGRVGHFCSTERQRYGLCGPQARYFEAKPVTYGASR